MNVFGKKLRSACTAKYFQAELPKERFGKNKRLSIFLKTIYFLNLLIGLVWMTILRARQQSGKYQSPIITVDFGTTVWDEAWVTIPEWLPRHVNKSSQVGQQESWTLVYSYFNGIYQSDSDIVKPHDNRPVYVEMSKVNDQSHFNANQASPAQIKYCKVRRM